MKMLLPGSWVVYRMAIKGHPEGINAVCEKREWDAMEADQPGRHTLIMSGIANEGEAERLARGTAGDTKPRGLRADTASTPPAIPPTDPE
ncbi:MAG TPA: hypothetical protein VM533_03600 [Fimbriiglobus sp.]|jgi:hypothetical protein|nr:hypothetical protein [Fimbriiglobus sp.]